MLNHTWKSTTEQAEIPPFAPFFLFTLDDSLSMTLLPPPDKPRLANSCWFSSILAFYCSSYSDGPCCFLAAMLVLPVVLASFELSGVPSCERHDKDRDLQAFLSMQISVVTNFRMLINSAPYTAPRNLSNKGRNFLS
jgi:hypothetical protein